MKKSSKNSILVFLYSINELFQFEEVESNFIVEILVVSNQAAHESETI